ncbi:MAG: carboxyl transferase domain-containing protein [Nocardioidaceae bacterium]
MRERPDRACGAASPSRARPCACPRTTRRAGQFFVRDRVDRLLDPGSPFLEVGTLAAHGMYDGASPERRHRHRHRAGVEERECRRSPSNGATVKRRHRATFRGPSQEAPPGADGRRSTNRLPCLYLVDSGGAFLPLAGRGVPRTSDHFGRIFFNQATHVAPQGIAQIAAVLGPAPQAVRTCRRCRTSPSIVKDQGTIFLGGPPLVKAATGEVVTAEDLGGGDAARPGLRRRRPPR